MPQVEKSRNDKVKVTRRDQVKVTHPITTAVYTQLLMTLCITQLNAAELTYPGTNFKLVYTLARGPDH